jgi:hypothetical protein
VSRAAYEVSAGKNHKLKNIDLRIFGQSAYLQSIDVRAQVEYVDLDEKFKRGHKLLNFGATAFKKGDDGRDASY